MPDTKSEPQPRLKVEGSPLDTLCYKFSSIQKRIVTPINVFNTLIEKHKNTNPVCATENALWDTGATISAITPKLVKDLSFIPAGTMAISGISGVLDVEFILAAIQLPDGILRENIKMAVCDFSQNINIILGMDIITLGDFELLHGNNSTVFSFTSPPSKKIKIM